MISIIDFISNNWKEIIEFFGGGGILISLTVFIWKSISNKCLYVREIKKTDDKDIDEFKRVYELIDEDLRIDSEDILAFLNQRNSDVMEHHLYICKKFNKTVGMLKFMVSRKNKYIFIAYLSIDFSDRDAAKYAMDVLLNKMSRKYFNKKIADKIITEIPEINGAPIASKAKRIKRYAELKKKHCYYLDFPYIQPDMPTGNNAMTEQLFLCLVIILLEEPQYLKLPKNDVLDIVRSIYWEIYAPSCDIDKGCNCQTYSNMICDLLNDYNSLEDLIELKKIQGRN